MEMKKKISRSKKQCTERLLEIGNNDGRMAKKKKAKSQESEIKAKKKFSFHLKNLSLFAIYTQNIATQTMNIFLITIFFQPVEEAFRAHTEAIQGFPPNDL